MSPLGGNTLMRSLQQLLTDQDQLRNNWRRSSQIAPQELCRHGSGPPSSTVRFGRVESVATSDPTHGPHLMVACLHATGEPPQWSEGPAPPLRCHIPPGRQITEYSSDQIVRLVFLESIAVAEPIG